MGFWGAVGEIAASAAVSVYGRDKVRNLVRYKIPEAKRELDKLVEQVASSQNRPLAAAILDEFGNRFQAAETRADQDDVNELLWYFKERVMAEVGELPQLDS